MITRSPVMICSNGMEPMRFDSISKASTSTGIPYSILLYIKKNSRKGATSTVPGAPERFHRVHSNGKEFTIIYHELRDRAAIPGPLQAPKCHTVISKTKLLNLTRE